METQQPRDRLLLIKSGNAYHPPRDPTGVCPCPPQPGAQLPWPVTWRHPGCPWDQHPHPAQQVALGFPPGGGGEPRAVSSGDSGEDSPLPKVCPRRPHIPDVPPPCPGIICLYPRYEQAFMEQLLWMRHLMYVTSKPHSFAKDLRFLSHHRWWD